MIGWLWFSLLVELLWIDRCRLGAGLDRMIHVSLCSFTLRQQTKSRSLLSLSVSTSVAERLEAA